MYASFLALLVLIMFSAYFSATETAFSSLNKIKIKNMANDGNKKAQLTLKLCEKYDKLLYRDYSQLLPQVGKKALFPLVLSYPKANL